MDALSSARIRSPPFDSARPCRLTRTANPRLEMYLRSPQSKTIFARPPSISSRMRFSSSREVRSSRNPRTFTTVTSFRSFALSISAAYSMRRSFLSGLRRPDTKPRCHDSVFAFSIGERILRSAEFSENGHHTDDADAGPNTAAFSAKKRRPDAAGPRPFRKLLLNVPPIRRAGPRIAAHLDLEAPAAHAQPDPHG